MMSSLLLGVALLATQPAQPATAGPDGLVTTRSAHSVRETIDRFEAAVRAIGWKLFAEIDHSAAAGEVGLSLNTRIVILFGNPKAGTGAMQAHPTLAIDLPMRVLVWQDEHGNVFLTRSTGDDFAERVFARHGIMVPAEGRSGNEATLADLVRKAVE